MRVLQAALLIAIGNSAFCAEPRVEALLFQKGDLHASWKPGKFEPKPPAMFDRLPQTKQRGYIPLLVRTDRRGGVAGFIYKSPDDAAEAYETIVKGMSRDNKPTSEVGEMARLHYLDLAGTQATDLVFLQGNVVVHMRLTGLQPEEVLPYAKKIDSRIREAFPEN